MSTSTSTKMNDTLIIACCDPSAGLLASQFAVATGLRLIVLPRSSHKSIEMLREGLVHLAGLHLSTHNEPERNIQFIRSMFGTGNQTVRLARCQAGIAVKPSARLRSGRSAMKANLNWIGRESGSGA